METAPDNDSNETPEHKARETDNSPTPSAVLEAALIWLRSFWNAPRQKSKWTEIVTVVLTLGIAVAAFWSAFIFQGQLKEARKATNSVSDSFRIDERAWIEIEPITPIQISKEDATFSAGFICNIYPKNVGRTVARDVVVKAQDMGGMEDFGRNAEAMRATQDKMLLGGFKEMGTNKPVIVPSNPVPKVLAPNSVSPAPFRLTCQAPQHFPDGHQALHYMVGRIDYCDQFQIKHWLKFCFYVVNARGEVWTCQEGNDEDANGETPTPETSCGKPN